MGGRAGHCSAGIAFGALALLVPASLVAQTPSVPAEAPALFSRYCSGCHNRKVATAGVSLEGRNLSAIGDDPALWERVLRKLRTEQMPPPGLPHPSAAEYAAVSGWLESSLDRAAQLHPDPGRTKAHRLNRAEYSNAVRDLLALDIKPGDLLPVDDTGFGFDNIADLLSISPALLERYMSAARLVSRLAVGDLATKPAEEQFTLPQKGSNARNEQANDDLPFDSRGGLCVPHYFPLDAEYGFRIRLAGGEGKPYEFKAPVGAGLHQVAVTFLRESAEPEMTAPPGRRAGPPRQARDVAPALMDLRLDGARIDRFEVPERGGFPEVDSLVLAGPYNPTGRGQTPSRAKIFVCRPTGAADEDSCARSILSTLALHAYRRPVDDADIRPLLAIYRSGRAAGDFDSGIEKALRAILVCPDFLFRVEADPAGAAPGSVYRLGGYELASRLSFFLWSSIPDDELLSLAGQGKLNDPAVLEAQVRRMLGDPRSDALIENFGGQWLYLRNLSSVRPDADAFPEFDETLRQSFRKETELLLASIFRENRSIFDLLDADYTYLNQRLAEHYGVPNVYGSEFRRVAITDTNRRGLLGQGSILTVTSYPNRTSVVQRGKWVLENLLGAPPPPPPPDVPELKAEGKDGRLLTMREQMEQHRANPICASCHSRMDPIGFALENYDGVGKWRTKEHGSVIDASGKLPDGTQFDGPAGLRKLLLEKYRADFAATFTEKLLTYALGRGLEPYDQPLVRTITRQAAGANYRVSAFIATIAQSAPFEMRRTASQ